MARKKKPGDAAKAMQEYQEFKKQIETLAKIPVLNWMSKEGSDFHIVIFKERWEILKEKLKDAGGEVNILLQDMLNPEDLGKMDAGVELVKGKGAILPSKEIIVGGKKKGERVCGNCGRPGHNKRTCAWAGIQPAQQPPPPVGGLHAKIEGGGWNKADWDGMRDTPVYLSSGRLRGQNPEIPELIKLREIVDNEGLAAAQAWFTKERLDRIFKPMNMAMVKYLQAGMDRGVLKSVAWPHLLVEMKDGQQKYWPAGLIW